MSTFSVQIPEAKAILKPIPPDQGAPYGLEYVFFAACAGELGPAPQGASANMLPAACYGPDKRVLGANDFVPGYTAIYVYADRSNANPIVANLLLDGSPIGSAAGPVPSPPRLARCAGSDANACLGHRLQVEIDRASAEIDPGAVSPDGRQLSEQLWVAFYTTRGDLGDELRLVNDAEQGWNDDNATEWHVPTTPGSVHLWGIVHDNRGGVSWTEGMVEVE